MLATLQRGIILEEFISEQNMDEETMLFWTRKAIKCNMDLNKVKYIAIGKCKFDFNNSELEQIDIILDSIKNYIQSRFDGIVIIHGMKIVCLIYDYLTYMIILKETVKYIKEIFNVDLFFGISQSMNHLHDFGKCYRQAKCTVQTIISIDDNNPVKIYDVLEVNQLILEINNDSREKYLKELFYNEDKKYIYNTLKLLKVYYRCNGSINETSKQLFIHKNTLQYRLNNIKNQLGYDPRKFNDAFIFQLAIKFLDMDKCSVK